METSILQQLNLNESEVITYEELLQSGEQSARQLTLKTPLKRGLIYKTLEDLVKKGLIIKNDETNKVSTFTPIHPNVLKGLAEQQLKQAQEAKENLDNELGSFISMYNLANNKPGVEFYEGIEGLEKVLNDTLTSKTEIYLFLNKNLLQQEKIFRAVNKEYKIKREKLGIKKKIIRVGKPQPTTRTTQSQDITSIKYFNHTMTPFNASIQIYDNKITYQKIISDKIISVIIQDEEIYKMNKAIFEYLWEGSI